jgi:DNA-binding NarL/FixJ family response regulator
VPYSSMGPATLDIAAFERMKTSLGRVESSSASLGIALGTLRAARSLAAAAPLAHGLTARERRILRLIADGHDNDAIAETLHFSLGTIKAHVRAILDTLKSPTRAAAAARAVRLGLI